MSATWRLMIDDVPASGAWNMALDRAVQLAHAAGDAPPTLRLYRWRVPTVTLGRFQPLSGVDLEACRDMGLDVVRRATGGRGVLHDDELTYSIVAGIGDGVPRGVSASYRMLCGALVETYRLLGVSAELTSRPRGSASSAACYLHATDADVSVGVAKLSGSAQVWYRDTVLQHGSYTRTRDVERDARVFRLDEQAARQLTRSTATLEALLEQIPGFERIAEAAAHGLEAALDVTLEPGGPTEGELETAEAILGEFML